MTTVDLSSDHQLLLDTFGTPASSIDEAIKRLNPELLPYLSTGPLGPMLRHPLLYELTLMTPDYVNKRYAAKLEAVKRALADDDWHRFLWLHERPYRIEALVKLLDDVDLPQEEQQALLRMIWVDTELPHQYGRMWLVRLFQRVGFVGLARPERMVTIYRGVRKPRHARGLSWTAELKTARWFGRRFGQGTAAPNGFVYAAEIAPWHILAVLHDRDESEVVVNPRYLQNVRLVEEEA